MKTAERIATGLGALPTAVTWYLERSPSPAAARDCSRASHPGCSKPLRKHALIESAVSSNRIEGVEGELDHVATLVFGQLDLRNRNEEEMRGYSDALNLMHSRAESLLIIQDTVHELHRVSRGPSARWRREGTWP